MADGTQPGFAAAGGTIDGGAVIFALAGARYALPLEAVDAVMAPPALCRVPHAPEALLGAGNLGGKVLPIVDPAAFFHGQLSRRRYDGGGEVLRVSAAGGAVGFWVDRVERLAAAGTAIGEAVTVIDPDPLVRFGMAAPALAEEPSRPLGDAAELVVRVTGRAAEGNYFLVEAAGERCQLAYDLVLEFLEPPPAVAIPGAPAGFLGVGIVRGEALPLLSLAALLGLPQAAPPTGFALMRLAPEGRLLLGIDRIIGLRSRQRRTGRRWVDQTAEIIGGVADSGREIELAAMLSDGLRTLVAAFAPAQIATETVEDGSGAPYLVFVAGGETYALPVAAVERVVPAQQSVALPRRPGAAVAITRAVELRGQLIPVAALDDSGVAGEPAAYVIMHGAAGLMAIGVHRVERLTTLRPEQISAPPGEPRLIDGIAVPDDGGDLLRILAADRIGRVE
ncbi:MAG TPA: chemotaxis protein CheW [Stellaceae bacterium]|nr:chemotaxis protein CheW [Stellaceae bacterium]